jgi:predicted GH43/DUF377 family glycosyl hydrolase
MAKLDTSKNKRTSTRNNSVKKLIKKLFSIRKERIIKKTKLLKKKDKPTSKTGAKLKRVSHNPIISPRLYPWESKATFNAAAFESQGKVHIIYRAVGEDDASVLGYAVSEDGYKISERPTYFVYKRNLGIANFELPIFYDSGGGWCGGCEDPRLTKIGDTVYMLYTAFDGWGSVRIAMTSIKLSDFENRKWKWEKPVFISPPGEVHKNWVLFPEKINGKFAILHSISPEVLVEYVDSMDEFDGEKFIKSRHGHSPRQEDSWDNWVRGVGPPPIKTEDGWLVLYHAMDNNDPNRYKLGAMILDTKNPSKVLHRSKAPILEPDEQYENDGWKAGVIYSCGAVVKLAREDDKIGKDAEATLFVYYGGADKVVCVASMDLQELIDDLKLDEVVTLKKDKITKS